MARARLRVTSMPKFMTFLELDQILKGGVSESVDFRTAAAALDPLPLAENAQD